MSPSRRGSFRFGGILPPHLRVLPSSLAASTALWIASRVFLSSFGIRQETEYLASPPLILFGSKMFAKEIRHGITTLVALEILLAIIKILHQSVFVYCCCPQSRTANSSSAVCRSTASLGSESGTSASLPGGLTTYSPRISWNFFFPMSFSKAAREISSVL